MKGRIELPPCGAAGQPDSTTLQRPETAGCECEASCDLPAAPAGRYGSGGQSPSCVQRRSSARICCWESRPVPWSDHFASLMTVTDRTAHWATWLPASSFTTVKWRGSEKQPNS